ncbi:HTH-type transcriptional regulator RutR, partial [Salmonella enterica subsp. enterica serovar Oranienburg]|nr:HTH-type transcriptional regulator RutR [Salmonella enterica subsp. enterica serovar Oranienburg]
MFISRIWYACVLTKRRGRMSQRTEKKIG